MEKLFVKFFNMSNIAKRPVKIESGVTVNIGSDSVVVNGPKGSLTTHIPQGISVMVEGDEVRVAKLNQSHDFEKFAGLARALVANMVKGVSVGFVKKLELTGVGYRAKVEGSDLVLNVGFATPMRVKPIDGVTIAVEENVITVSGIDKQLVGDVASDIRRVRPPDPYKGKGIRYQGEKLRRKVGKAAKAVGAK